MKAGSYHVLSLEPENASDLGFTETDPLHFDLRDATLFPFFIGVLSHHFEDVLRITRRQTNALQVLQLVAIHSFTFKRHGGLAAESTQCLLHVGTPVDRDLTIKLSDVGQTAVRVVLDL